jgi:hypothetical protein
MEFRNLNLVTILVILIVVTVALGAALLRSV